MRKGIVKTVARGTIILFAGVGVNQTYTIIKDFKNPTKIERPSMIEEAKDFLDKMFNSEPTPQGPSATNSPKIENIGKKVDELLGNDSSWDETSGIDSYGEALAGTIEGFLSGTYISQTPSSEEMKTFIQEDNDKIIEKIELIKNDDTTKNTYLQNLDRVVTSMFVGNYDKDKFNEALNILNNNYAFILNGSIYHNRNITF